MYSVVVSNAYGSVTSVGARLGIIVSPPYILSGPEDQTVLAGSTATFSVEADGDEPLNYQWQKNGTNMTDGGNILGSATSTLTINSASVASAGTYSVVVSNDLDYVTSDGAVLTVIPVIQPGSFYQTLHSFSSTGSDGLNPYAGLFQAKDGLLYGTTLYGGTSGYGTAFRVTTSGSFTIRHSFTNGADGAFPYAGLMQAVDGNFYGAAFQGGTNSSGTIYKFTSTAVFTPVYAFLGGDDGGYPAAGLIQGTDGKFYGTSYEGGTNGVGGVFSVTTNGSFTSLAAFDQDNGAYPEAALVQAANGVLYGTTTYGGDNGIGTVFSVTTNGALTTLVSFDYVNGAYPVGGLIQAKDGLLYGTTAMGGTNGGWGTAFRMTADGTLTTLYSFGYDDGAYPSASLSQATDGNFYGTTTEGGWGGQGTVFRLTPNGVLTTVVWFNGPNGANPQSPVIQERFGSFCGTTEYGGINYNGAYGTGNGVVYRLVLPMFLSNPFTQAAATATVPYAATLNSNTIRPAGDNVQYSKLAGPAWLTVASDGTLSGTPAVSDMGTNTYTVTMFDPNGWSCTATMYINVVPTPWIKVAMVRQGGNLWLTWSGRTAPYQVQAATSPISPFWVNIGGPLYTNRMSLIPAAATYYRVQGQ